MNISTEIHLGVKKENFLRKQPLSVQDNVSRETL